MKTKTPSLRKGALAASALFAGLIAAPVSAATGAGGHEACGPFPSLSVSGTGESRVAPDLAVITFGVTTEETSAAEAMRENAARQTAVIDAVKAAGVEARNIQTSGVNLSPVIDYRDNGPSKITGHRASNMVAVRVSDIAGMGGVLDAIVAAGANEINGISFERLDKSAAQDEARRAAVADARHKAEVLSDAAGLTLGATLTIRDTPAQQGPSPVMMRAEAASQDMATPIEAGEILISAEVQIDYALAGQDSTCPTASTQAPAQ